MSKEDIDIAYATYRSLYTTEEWKSAYFKYSRESFEDRCRRDKIFYHRYYKNRHLRTLYYFISILIFSGMMWHGASMGPSIERGLFIMGGLLLGTWQATGLLMHKGIDPFEEL